VENSRGFEKVRLRLASRAKPSRVKCALKRGLAKPYFSLTLAPGAPRSRACLHVTYYLYYLSYLSSYLLSIK
jgi:hypothetical protein